MGPRRKPKTSANNSSRRRRLQKNNNTLVESPIDRISALPDSVLGVILSFLPDTKNAVATSILSKRWEFLWRTVHNLDFCHAAGWASSREEIEEENNKFVGFVNHVLIHHDAGILNKFRLVWTPYCIQSHVTSWIKAATSRNVGELSLTLQSYDDEDDDQPLNMMMSISLFSCESLRSLKLNGDIICLSVETETAFCLPKLERLDLKGVTFQSVEAFEEIIKGCPMLSYLIIQMTGEDRDDSDFTYVISSTSLTSLELNLGAGRGAPRLLKLDASSLEHLKIYSRGFVSTDFVLTNLASLVEAKIDIFISNGSFTSVVDAVAALDRAKILSLSCDVMRVLSCASIKLFTDFKRLVKLETGTYCCHWGSLQDLIQSSNNLEVLTIHRLYMYASEHDHSKWISPVEVPECLSTSLKKVVIDGYTGHEDEREMIGYMLEHGRVLEDLQISCCMSTHDKQDELLEELNVFPIKSPACKVKFCGWTSTSNVEAM